MKWFRKAVFWVHLSVGLLAGLVILVMAVTGVLMSFERQIAEATSGVKVLPGAGGVGPEAILAAHAGMKPAVTAVVFMRDPEKPVVVEFGREKMIFVEPSSGASLGEGNTGVRKFFAFVVKLHRWLALEGAGKAVGKGITGVANLVFLFLVISGLWLWIPKRWSAAGVKAITRIQWRLRGRARDWNWHNVFGFWACLPLFLTAITGAVMSYSWANDLVFRSVGEVPPPPRGKEAPAKSPSSRGGGAEFSGLDAGFEAVKAGSAAWRTIQISVPNGKSAKFTVADSHRGRPDLRRVVTVDLPGGQIVKSEGFQDQSPGRQLRTWVRWIHTGEAFGWIGQIVAGLAAMAAVVLVYTGFALSWRRFFRRGKAA